jgi:LemA protein
MMWFFLIVLLIVVVLALYAVGLYNGFVRSRNLIQESWRQIDVELNRRYDLIPNLVETVRAYAAHERNTLENVTRLRNQAAALSGQDGATPERAQAEEALSGAVRGLMVSVEAYPDLKSNVNFLELQRELTATEDRIAAGRRFYNANVRNYNTQVESFPSVLVANMFHFEKATYFEVNDQAVRQAPHISFGEISERPGGQEPTNDQLSVGPTASGMPNPQAYDQGSLGAPAPGGFDAPAPAPVPAYEPPAYQPPAQQTFQQPPAVQPPVAQPPADPPTYAPPQP